MKGQEIFRAGNYHDGQAVFSETDVESIATGYDPALLKAPLTLDHIQSGKSYGWVDALTHHQGRLLAFFTEVSDDLKEMYRKGEYRSVSAEIYQPDHPSNPTPGKPYLKAVSFLGARIPEVKGLKPVELGEEAEALFFGERIDVKETEIEVKTAEIIKEEELSMQDDDKKLEKELRAKEEALRESEEKVKKFSEETSAKDEKIRELELKLAQEQHERKVADFQRFAEEMIDEGKLTPKLKEKVVFLLDALEQMSIRDYAFRVDGAVLKSGEYFSFAEKDENEKARELSPADVLMDILKGQPKVMEFGEKASTGIVANDLDSRAQAIVSEKGVSYREAVKMAKKGG